MYLHQCLLLQGCHTTWKPGKVRELKNGQGIKTKVSKSRNFDAGLMYNAVKKNAGGSLSVNITKAQLQFLRGSRKPLPRRLDHCLKNKKGLREDVLKAKSNSC